MSVFINNLNISNLFILQNSPINSVEFCFLYATNPAFRSKSPDKQLNNISKLRASLGNQIQKIVHSDKNTSKKKLIMDYNPNLHINFLNDSQTYSSDYQDFLFVIQVLVKSHKFIIASNTSFEIFQNTVFEPSDKIIIIHESLNKSLQPVYFELDNQKSFVFSKQSSDFIHIIDAFHSNKDISSSYITLDEDEVITSSESSTTTDDIEERVFIIDDDDLLIEDIDDDLVVKYNNKSFLQSFNNEEQEIYIQNLLTSTGTKFEYQSSRQIVHLMNNRKTNQSPFEKNIYLFINPIKLSSIHKKFNDHYDHIDSFNEFKQTFPNKPFYNSCFYQDDQQKTKNILVDNNSVIRNSFTQPVAKLDNTNNITFDYSECIEHVKFEDLSNTIKKYNLPNIKGTKQKLCKALVAYDFMEDLLRDKLSNYDTTYLKEIATSFDSVFPPKSSIDSKKKLIKFILKNSSFFAKHLLEIITIEDISNIVSNHNLPLDIKDKSTMFHTLQNTNLLELNKANFNLPPSYENCLIDDPLTSILISDSVQRRYQLKDECEMFTSLSKDNLSFDGFFCFGNKTSSEYEIFDVANYINILTNIRKFLPIKCTLCYFNDLVITGTITSTIQNNKLLKITRDDNTITYYNLHNLLDNKFYLYPSIYDGYRFKKSDFQKNVLFIINNYDFADMVKFVSLTFNEYIELFDVSIRDMEHMNTLLKSFDTSFHDINHYTFEEIKTLVKQTNKESQHNSKIPSSSETNKKTSYRESNKEFLKFNTDDIDDLHKMFLLHKTNVFKVLYDMNKTEYVKHSFDSLKTSISFVENNRKLHAIPTTQDVFEQMNVLDEFKNNHLIPLLEENNDIILTKRKAETTAYLDNLETRLEEYTSLYTKYTDFINANHVKTFMPEMTYSNKKTKTLHGTVSSENLLVNSDPLNQYTTIENDNIDDKNNTVDLGVLSHLSTISGIKLTNVEKKFIHRQVNTIIYPALTVNKLKKGAMKEPEATLWKHYVQSIGYSAFFTLFTQYKYDINTIFDKCKNSFSLHGYPLDDTTSKTFTKYLSCVLYSLFAKKNPFFKSLDYIDSQIIAIIRLIFQSNPAIKDIFNDALQQHKQHKTKTDFTKSFTNIKPFNTYGPIDKKLIPNINNQSLSKNFKIHGIDEYDFNTLLYDHFLLQHVRFNRPEISKITQDIIVLKDVATYKLPQVEDTSSTNNTTEEENNTLTSQIDEIKALFQLTPLVSRFKDFVDAFVVSANNDNYDINNYYYLFNYNQFYRILLEKDDETFLPYKSLFENNIVDPNQNNMNKKLLNMFTSYLAVLQEIFDTTNLQMYVYLETDTEKKQLLFTMINEFKHYLDDILNTFENQFFNVDDLKNKAEILREEEKQQKLTKYDNMDDDMMYIFMKLEQSGIPIDFDSIVESSDDIENEQLNLQSEDDDYPE